MTLSDRKLTLFSLWLTLLRLSFIFSAGSSQGGRDAPASAVPLPQPAPPAPVPSGSPQPPCAAISHPVALRRPWATATLCASPSPSPATPHPPRTQGAAVP